MSPLVKRALERAGLGDIARARLEGSPLPEGAKEKLESADLLALGALADAVRVLAAGDVVAVHLREPRGLPITWVKRDETRGEGGQGAQGAGLAVLRRVAVARVLASNEERVGVDYMDTGLELAQVALGFGASELLGVLVNKRGLPIADDATKRVKGQGQVSAQLLQQKEIEQVLVYVGRRAVFHGDTARDEKGTVLHA